MCKWFLCSSAEGHRKTAEEGDGASAPCSLGVGRGDRCVWDTEKVRQLYWRRRSGGGQGGPGQLPKVSQGGLKQEVLGRDASDEGRATRRRIDVGE